MDLYPRLSRIDSQKYDGTPRRAAVVHLYRC